MTVLDFLLARNHVGAENAVKQKELEPILNLNRREIRAEIERINGDIRENHMINFNNNGIYVVDHITEYMNLRKRAKRSILRNVARLRKCDYLIGGTSQVSIEDILNEEDDLILWD